MIGGFILIFYMSHLFYIFIFVMHSFWVPQIICNAQKCSRRPVLWYANLIPSSPQLFLEFFLLTIYRQYVIGMSVTRLTIPLYFYGCPHNFLSVEPSSRMCFLLTAYMVAQVLVMYLQDKKGPQFFIPRRVCSRFLSSLLSPFPPFSLRVSFCQ